VTGVHVSIAWDPEGYNSIVAIPFDVDPDKGLIDYAQVARHECGHAVVAIAKGKGVKRIRLGRSIVQETHAETRHEPQEDPPTECLVASAGVVAERLLGSGSAIEDSAKLDHDKIRWLVRESPGKFRDFEDRDHWFSDFIKCLEEEAGEILTRDRDLYDALVFELDRRIAEWNWKPEPFGLWEDDIRQIISRVSHERMTRTSVP
jgi:hypothetical protein